MAHVRVDGHLRRVGHHHVRVAGHLRKVHHHR